RREDLRDRLSQLRLLRRLLPRSVRRRSSDAARRISAPVREPHRRDDGNPGRPLLLAPTTRGRVTIVLPSAREGATFSRKARDGEGQQPEKRRRQTYRERGRGGRNEGDPGGRGEGGAQGASEAHSNPLPVHLQVRPDPRPRLAGPEGRIRGEVSHH